LAWSAVVLDTEPCQPAWAVGQQLLNSNDSCAKTFVSRC